jgi:hypothetical protein
MGREIRVCVYWSLCGASVRMRGIRSPPDMQSLKNAYVLGLAGITLHQLLRSLLPLQARHPLLAPSTYIRSLA